MKFLPKNFESCGVNIAPLGRRATVDTIVFRCPVDCYDGEKESFCIGRNIKIKIYKFYKNWFIEVRVCSLTKFVNGRSSSLISDYFAVLLALNSRVNSELIKRSESLSFDAFASEIIRLDVFVDLRFRNKSEMNYFYEMTKNLVIPALPYSLEYFTTRYFLNNDNLKNSTEYLKIYDKEFSNFVKRSKEKAKNKIRVECSLQNKSDAKPIDDFLERLEQPEISNVVKIKSDDSKIKYVHRVYQNKYQSNVFSLLTQTAIDAAFGFVSNGFLTA